MGLTHFSLFSGIGGIDLAVEWAGFQTVGQCEFADYPTKVLEKHWPTVQRWRDVRSVTAESVRERGISNITLLSGGFPCQPFSEAGKQRGKEDDRYLWPEMCRVISEVEPTWILGENVTGIINLALDEVLSDLENIKYAAIPFVIPACSVGAWHIRERTFIIAHANDSRLQASREERVRNDEKVYARRTSSEHLRQAKEPIGIPRGEMWSTEPSIHRVANGVPARVDRLKCLGNAVVPQQVYPILKAIADIENGVEVDDKYS